MSWSQAVECRVWTERCRNVKTMIIILRRIMEKASIITSLYCILLLSFNRAFFQRTSLKFGTMDLNQLPGSLDKISQRDLQHIETERRRFWERFFLKIEESYDSADDTEAIEEIDEPIRVQERERRAPRFTELPSSKTFRRWCRDNGEYLDELTTIAGPPAEDEEDIGEEILEEDEEGLEEEMIEETWSQSEDEEDEMAEVKDKLCCTRCGQQTNYDPDITEDEDRFCCDFCLLGFHPECEEECEPCRNIASILEQRWKAAGVDPCLVLQAFLRQ